MNCIYCKKELSPKGLSHQIYCKDNPNRKVVYRSGDRNPMYGKKGSNSYIKAKNEGRTYKISEETRQKLSKASKGRILTEEHKNNLSSAMRKVVREKPESYSGSNVNGRTKKSEYNGFMMDSNWELEFAKWCDIENIKWIKPKTGFEYEWNGKRLYYPDFYLPELDIYVEVKGYQRDRDLAKWSVVPNLIVIKVNEIKKIKEGNFKLVL
jgi:hypothetical protein